MNPKSFVDLANEISFDVHLMIFCIPSTLSLAGFVPVPLLLTGFGQDNTSRQQLLCVLVVVCFVFLCLICLLDFIWLLLAKEKTAESYCES